MLNFHWFYKGLGPPGREVTWGVGGCQPRLTESDFRRLEVVCGSLGIYYYEVVSPGSPGAGVGRLTESDFRRLEVVRSSLGIYYYVSSIRLGRHALGVGGFRARPGPHFH